MTGKLPRVLCVDDNKIYCEVLNAVMTIGDKPLRLEFAHDGEAAMNCLLDESTNTDPYKILILDVHVPKSANEKPDVRLGLKLHRLLDQHRSLSLLRAGTPIIIHTAFPSFSDCVECMKRGAADYIPKTDLDTNTKNVEVLSQRCRELAYPQLKLDLPAREWLNEHFSHVSRQYGGQCLALISPHLKPELPTVGDFAILQGVSYDDVRRKLIADRELRWETPCIMNLPPFGEDATTR